MQLSISAYGTLISLSILICILIAEKRVKSLNKPTGILWDITLIAIISGLIGARVYHVIDLHNYYLLHPLEMFFLWKGGLGIWGGIFGALAGVFIYMRSRHKEEPSLFWLDIMASVVPLGQALGRWGNYLNQENFGLPTTLPWGIYVEPQRRPEVYINANNFHPIFIYESLLNLVLFFILSKLAKKYPYGNGKILGLYLLGYSIIRFGVEFFKLNPWELYGINVAQLVALVAALGGIVLIRRRTLV